MAGRKTNLTSSVYVTGNISQKHRETWVRAIPEKPDFSTMDDEQLGLTAKACTRIRTNARNALNKVNKEGQSKGWNNHVTALKKEVQNQLDKIEPFYKLLHAEADRREAEENATDVLPVMDVKKAAEKFIATAEFPVDGDPKFTIDSLGGMAEENPQDVGSRTADVDMTLYALLKDSSLQEILEFAKQGVEAENQSSTEELEEKLKAAEESAVFNCKRADEAEARLAKEKQSHTELREAHRQLKADYRKLKNAANELQNMAKRLQSLQ